MAKIVYQGHHPSRKLFPNYTIKLRKWIHMFVRRLEQFSPTASNVEELRATEEAVSWIRRIKELQFNGHLPKDKDAFNEWVDKELDKYEQREKG